MTINVLGTEYKVIVKPYDSEDFNGTSCGGFCNAYAHEILICDLNTHPEWEKEDKKTIENCVKTTTRHEIVHAFFNESGLCENSNTVERWARNEEMIDWIAIQGAKIYKAWQEAGAV